MQTLHCYRLLKLIKVNKQNNLSWGMILLNLFASILWFIYGIIILKYPIIIANCCYFIANISICIMKTKYTHNNKTIEQNDEQTV